MAFLIPCETIYYCSKCAASIYVTSGILHKCETAQSACCSLNYLATLLNSISNPEDSDFSLKYKACFILIKVITDNFS